MLLEIVNLSVSVIWASFFPQPSMDIFLSPSGRDCPLLQVLSGKVDGAEVEGSLPWIVSWLLEGNNYSGLLLRLDPLGDLGESVGFFGKLWDLALGLPHPLNQPVKASTPDQREPDSLGGPGFSLVS